jgi:hypothetical protein
MRFKPPSVQSTDIISNIFWNPIEKESLHQNPIPKPYDANTTEMPANKGPNRSENNLTKKEVENLEILK